MMTDHKNNGNSCHVTHLTARIEKALSVVLAEAGREFEKKPESSHSEESSLAMKMATLCAIARLAAKRISAFGLTNTPGTNGALGNSEEKIHNLFIDLLEAEKEKLRLESH